MCRILDSLRSEQDTTDVIGIVSVEEWCCEHWVQKRVKRLINSGTRSAQQGHDKRTTAPQSALLSVTVA
jgi:hypothetical protein